VTEQQTALEAAAALWPFWWQRGHMNEGRELLERAATIDGADRPHALKGLGTIAFRQGDTEAAERAFLERLELVEGEGEASLSARSPICRASLCAGATSRRFAGTPSAAMPQPKGSTGRRSVGPCTCAPQPRGWTDSSTRRARSTSRAAS
jgi:hypothetical protein